MWIFVVIGIIVIAIVWIFFIIKNKIWDEPQFKIAKLENDIEKLQSLHKKELELLNKRINSFEKDEDANVNILKNELIDTVMCYAWKEVSELYYKKYAFLENPNFFKCYYKYCLNNYNNKENITKVICKRFEDAIEEQYKYKYIICIYPEISNLFDGVKLNHLLPSDISDATINKTIFEIVHLFNENKTAKEFLLLKNKLSFLNASQSNLTAIPYMAQIMADYETYGLEILAKELDWGYSYERSHKVKSIREIRKDAQAMVEKNKEAQYQLAYLLELFPNLQDVIDCEFKQLPPISVNDISEYDATKDYLSKEEYNRLSTTERNQLALDRYKLSNKKSKWQIGRDYELFIGYKYSLKGYDVDYFGSYMGLEDLGRDLIAKKDNITLIIQCKYWSSNKLIHEKHITQLYGTMMSYCVENNCEKANVKGILITNIRLSDMAKKMAKFLEIEYKENVKSGNYPCVKCKIGHNEYGQTKIYHLPFDQQYDVTKIKRNKGDFFAMTVEEAEKAGFRRAYKWFGNN